jgi:hypothetical protein
MISYITVDAPSWWVIILRWSDPLSSAGKRNGKSIWRDPKKLLLSSIFI